MKSEKTKNRICSIATVVFMIIYIVWRLGFTAPIGKGAFPVVCWVILTLVELIGLVELSVFIIEFRTSREIVPPAADTSVFPDVDVFIFTINEPDELLAKTIFACKKMKYPDKNRVHIYLCDDGSRETMHLLADKMGINYLNRRVNTDAKAGNFNYALVKSHSPLIAIFDADMMPKENFLMKTVPYFQKDGKVGFVQTPQHFYRKDIFQRAFPNNKSLRNEQDYFYQVIQETKNSSNSVILAGSNTLISREAVEKIGGFVTGTLTEDFSTGIELEKNGYKGISINEVLADGLPPMDFHSLIKQRKRWARGCIQAGKKTEYLKSRTLSLRQKLNYFSSIIYWYSSLKRIIYLVCPILFGLFGIGIVRCTPLQILVFWLPLYFFINLCIYRFSGKIRSLYQTNIYETVLMPFLLPAVLKEMIGFHKSTFDVTVKSRNVRNKKVLLYILPFAVLLVFSVLSVGMVIYRSYMEATYSYSLMLIFLLINCFYLYTACRMILSGKQSTEDEYLNTDEMLQYKDDSEPDFVNIKTTRLSENGFTTGIYDECWKGGIVRIKTNESTEDYAEIRVKYEKEGNWKIEKDCSGYNEYLYFIYNRNIF